jgi:hypothetical protein
MLPALGLLLLLLPLVMVTNSPPLIFVEHNEVSTLRIQRF